MTKKSKIDIYDRYIMQGGDMTLDEIEKIVKESLGLMAISLAFQLLLVQVELKRLLSLN